MKGLDWPAVRKTYEQKLRETDNSMDFYWKVLGPMLMLLESSHVGAISPSSAILDTTDEVPLAVMPAVNIESCGGLLIAFPRRSILARIVSLEPASPLYERGVRAGWRFLGWSPGMQDGSTEPALDFLSTAGERLKIDIPSTGVVLSHLKEDLATFGKLRVSGSSPETMLKMKSIDSTVLLGKNASLPYVVNVLNGSEAERAGIEPGSTFTSLQMKNGPDGAITLDGKLTSPSSRSYSADFKFRKCDIPDRNAELLPGGVLHVRFDQFRPDVVPWLDEQLRTNPRAIVLDLRNNKGGRVTTTREILGRFVDEGTPIATEIRAHGSEVVTATDAPRVFKGPVAVLVSPLSTSAAEVSASALRFHERAKLFGQTTGGDVLLSTKFRLADGGLVQVAIADMLDPGGNRLENVGVKPDQEVLPTLETVRAGRDVVLEAALADLATKLE
jgi:hypothetical protein